MYLRLQTVTKSAATIGLDVVTICQTSRMQKSEHTSVSHYILSCICISFIRQLVFVSSPSAYWLAPAMKFHRYKDVCVKCTGNKVTSRLDGKSCCDIGPV